MEALIIFVLLAIAAASTAIWLVNLICVAAIRCVKELFIIRA